MICSHHRTRCSDFLTVTSLVIIVDVAAKEGTRPLHERMNELNHVHGLYLEIWPHSANPLQENNNSIFKLQHFFKPKNLLCI